MWISLSSTGSFALSITFQPRGARFTRESGGAPLRKGLSSREASFALLSSA